MHYELLVPREFIAKTNQHGKNKLHNYMKTFTMYRQMYLRSVQRHVQPRAFLRIGVYNLKKRKLAMPMGAAV